MSESRLRLLCQAGCNPLVVTGIPWHLTARRFNLVPSVSGLASFLPVPVNGRVASGHGETVRRYQVPIDGSEVTCHDEIVSVTSKKQGTSALAGNPIDFVSAAGTVRMQQNLIS
jgi:hypothetical protein